MSRSRGFTLLEVLVAVSILGLGLTVILSSQASLFATSARSEKLSLAVSLARCRMSETELELIKMGYPLADESHEGECCAEGESDEGFSCSWKVERVKLPEASLGAELDGGTTGEDGLGALTKLGEISKGGPEALGDTTDLGSLASELGGASTEGIAPMMMSMVYPQLKPMLEASIRKVTVTIAWKEGKTDRSLDIVQFVTDPQQGELEGDAGAANALGTALGGMMGGSVIGGDGGT